MKRFIFILSLLAAMGMGMCAQKSYVHIDVRKLSSPYQYIRLTGDVPAGVRDFYDYYDYHTIGEVLNLLAERGFELEFIAAPGMAGQVSDTEMCYVLSRTGSTDSAGSVKTVKSDSADDVYEVARYNLQGLPVSPDAKGVQIVVFSNYTTQTVIVE